MSCLHGKKLVRLKKWLRAGNAEERHQALLLKRRQVTSIPETFSGGKDESPTVSRIHKYGRYNFNRQQLKMFFPRDREINPHISPLSTFLKGGPANVKTTASRSVMLQKKATGYAREARPVAKKFCKTYDQLM